MGTFSLSIRNIGKNNRNISLGYSNKILLRGKKLIIFLSDLL
jgi:hypothetical protein